MQAATRAQDYLYDANYTVSNHRDHMKAMSLATQHTITIHPVQQNMFSALAHYSPRQFILTANRTNKSLGIDRRDYHRGALKGAGGVDVGGMNRYRYFKRPLIPYTPSLGGAVVYAKKPAMIEEVEIARPKSPRVKNASVQTQYRDSTVQTVPYSPEYTITSQTTPELLALASLTYSKGLPVGVVELEMIERARMKRAWELTLPQVVDQETFEKRLRMMEEMELREWKERDDEIKRIQDVRLGVLAQVIRKREAENECINVERVEKIWQRKLQEREAFLDTIEKKRVKALRKLTEKRAKIASSVTSSSLDGSTGKRDIIQEYADFTSRIYAPKMRDGAQTDRAHANLQLQIKELEEYIGIERLEAQIPSQVFTPNTVMKCGVKVSGSDRVEQHMQQHLELMNTRLTDCKAHESSLSAIAPLKFAQKILKPPLRPTTPHAVPAHPHDIKRELSALLIQKILRGRINQNAMYMGKERRRELIAELRIRQSFKNEIKDLGPSSTSATTPQAVVEEESESDDFFVEREGIEIGFVPQSLDGEWDSNIYKDTAASNQTEHPILAPLQSEYIAQTLDFLTKELSRLRQEQVIAAVVRLAERTRRLREAEESGRRAEELQRREISDAVFKEILAVHCQTVDSYLESVIEGSVDYTSATQARVKVGEYAARVNDVVDSMMANDESERTVSDLVASFLIPHVERSVIREKLRNGQDRFLVAAHMAIHAQTPAIEQRLLGDRQGLATRVSEGL